MTDRVDAYADACVAIAQAEGVAERVQEELFRVARTLDANHELRNKLTDETLPVELRQSVVEELLGVRAARTTTALVSFIIGAGRARDLSEIVERVVAHLAENKGELVGEIRSATALNDDEWAKLDGALLTFAAHPVDIKHIVDPSLIGGVMSRIGDVVIDTSLRSRIQELKERI